MLMSIFDRSHLEIRSIQRIEIQEVYQIRDTTGRNGTHDSCSHKKNDNDVVGVTEDEL